MPSGDFVRAFGCPHGECCRLTSNDIVIIIVLLVYRYQEYFGQRETIQESTMAGNDDEVNHDVAIFVYKVVTLVHVPMTNRSNCFSRRLLKTASR